MRASRLELRGHLCIVCSFSHRCFRTLPEPAAAVPVFWRPRSSPRVCAYGFVAFRRGACRVLGLILRRSHILWRCHEGMPWRACVAQWYFWVPVLLWVPGYFLVHVLQVPKPASGWRPRVSGARATRLASTASILVEGATSPSWMRVLSSERAEHEPNLATRVKPRFAKKPQKCQIILANFGSARASQPPLR